MKVNIIIALLLSTFALTTHTKVLNLTLPWKGRIIGGIQDVAHNGLIASIRRNDSQPAFSAIVISEYNLLCPASCTKGHTPANNFLGISVLISNEPYDVKYIESHSKFVPEHNEYDLAVMSVKRSTSPEDRKPSSPKIQEQYICRNLAPEGTPNFHLGGFLMLRAFLNSPYGHCGYQKLNVKIVQAQFTYPDEAYKYMQFRAFAIAPAVENAFLEKYDIGGGIFSGEMLVGVLTQKPDTLRYQGYFFTSVGEKFAHQFIHAAVKRGTLLIENMISSEASSSIL